MLCGDLPFTGDSAVDIAMKQVSDTPPPLHRRNRLVSPAMEQVVMRALAKDPALRFSSARQMAEELARVGRGQSRLDRHAAGDPRDRRRRGHPRHRPADRGRDERPAPAPAAPPPERPAPTPQRAGRGCSCSLLLALAAVAGFVVYKMLSGNDKTVPQSRHRPDVQAGASRR